MDGIHGNYTFQFKRQRNTTICLIYDPLSNQIFAGAATLGPGDTFDEDIGKAISQGRAFADLAQFYAKYAYAS